MDKSGPFTHPPDSYCHKCWIKMNRINVLEAENFALAANQCHHGISRANGDHGCKYQDTIAELEAKVERLKKALEETPCSCIGPRPCRKEGTKCSRCVALESKMEKGE